MTSRAEIPARAMPWSTRAVILLAFAIHLAPVSERLPGSVWRASDGLTLSDGVMLTRWAAEGAIDQGSLGVLAAGQSQPVAVRSDLASLSFGLVRRSGVCDSDPRLLPIPPPARG